MRVMVAIAVGYLSIVSLSAADQARASINIPPQRLGVALEVLAKDRNLQLVYITEEVAELRTQGAVGELTSDEALQHLLHGTGLTYRFVDQRTITILPMAAGARLPGSTSPRASSLSGGEGSTPTMEQSGSGDYSLRGINGHDVVERGGGRRTWERFRLAQADQGRTAGETSASHRDGLAAESSQMLEEVVVTGVFTATSKQETTAAISTLSSAQIATLAPVSASDLLKNIPGVHVDSSKGEIFNNVTVRGLPTAGFDRYFYVSMQEDGLPISAANSPTPDLVLRADLTLDHIEAVRGGSAAVTGTNSPGGVFNYISKTGGDALLSAVSLNYGLQGDGSLPYYRSDINIGGPLVAGWHFNIGGFYRRDDGSIDAGYPLNEGGQLKANLTRKFERGSLMLYGKWLDDHNTYSQQIPVVNFDSPRPAPGWTNTSSVLSPRGSSLHYPTGPSTSARWDPTNLYDITAQSIGVNLVLDLGGSWTLNNNLKFSRNRTSSQISDFALLKSIGDPLTYLLYLGDTGPVAQGAAVLRQPGLFTYSLPGSNQFAQVRRDAAGQYTIIHNTLPGQDSLRGAMLNEQASNRSGNGEDWVDQISVTKQFDRMSFTAGAFFDRTRFDGLNLNLSNGQYVTFEPRPRILDVTFLPDGGEQQQVTNSSGYGPPINAGQGSNHGTWRQWALFFGHQWDFADRWGLDWGVRYERVDVTNTRQQGTRLIPIPNGGMDGDTSTIYDEAYSVFVQPFTIRKNLDTFSYSAAINYEFDDSQAAYLRYSLGKKSPNPGFYDALTTPATQSNPLNAQKITQIELGYKFRRSGYDISVTPFYSTVEDIASTSPLLFDDEGNVITRTAYNSVRDYGVEVDGAVDVGHGFHLRGAVTYQNGTVTKFRNFSQPGGIGTPVVTTDYSGNKEQNTPDFLVTLTPSYSIGPFLAQLQWQYVGERQANAANAFRFPAYNKTDLTLQWTPLAKPALNLSLTVNNLFDQFGVTSFSPPGQLLVAVNPEGFQRAQLEANPDAVFFAQTIQARAYFLRMTCEF